MMRFKVLSALLCCAACIFAQNKENEATLKQRVDGATEKKVSGEWGGKNPSARGCPPNSGLYLRGDFLWWRAENQGYTYASSTTDGFADGKIIRVHPEWDPGFRIIGGWNTSYDVWDWTFVWTWYQNKSHSKHSLNLANGDEGGFVPLFPVSHQINQNYRNAQGNYRLLHNAIDMELGRAYFITKALSFRPHFGVRGAWLNQKFHDFFSGSLNNVAEFKRFRGKNNYWGVGPRAGTCADYHLGKGFRMIGQAAVCALYGHTNVSFHSDLFEPTEDTHYVLDRTFKDGFDELVPNLQLVLGLDWSTCLRRDTMFFGVSVAWETNYWWNQFNLPVVLLSSVDSPNIFAPLPNVGNQPVTMEGITANARLDF